MQKQTSKPSEIPSNEPAAEEEQAPKTQVEVVSEVGTTDEVDAAKVNAFFFKKM